MHIDEYRDFVMSKKGVTEELPFGPDTLVFKVMGKVFALVPLDTEDFRISLKNTPEKNQDLRASYPGIQGAFHMNKLHWSMFLMNMGIPSSVLQECTNDSYNLVVKGLTKKLQAELENL
ncbi:MmcQ/YjbR family DNA-binding protein [Marinilongibacter aquaticus]|uniref:MmcQ/YjbR family DNA-binding protein n=1 Tax=Marinilongibacter aquaticus TaxID=2975157 RepID=UPI0021BD4719|nr:MmcQ/YjbR family DNA-binding protein [Marinilongibacter aquaticus]UBM59122.1 MmcQ/YjbR family DNA-binding protein [Marinilongibacter aquaticus]